MPESDAESPPVPSAQRCRTCDRPAKPEFEPFCSDRCRLLDLGSWLDGDRGIPLGPDESDELDEEPW